MVQPKKKTLSKITQKFRCNQALWHDANVGETKHQNIRLKFNYFHS